MTIGSESPRPLYWPQLDGLRFFAAFFVFIHHAQPLPGVPLFVHEWGWVGVDLFLVLSAFLLTRLMRAEIERSIEPNLRHYFLRRIFRIWPLHWGYVTAMLLLAYLQSPETFNAKLFVWFSHIAFFNNFVTAAEGYGTGLPYTSHLWTISLEEQYYLLVPFVVPLLVRIRDTRKVAWVIGASLLALWAARATCVLLETAHPFIWVLPVRVDAMILGTALGLGVFNRNMLGKRAGLCFAAGLFLLYAATWFPPIDEIGWGQVPVYTVVDTACIFLVMGALGNRAIGAFFSLPVLRYLGKISFGIYVYHVFILSYAKRIAATIGIEPGWALFLASLLLTCIVASLSYELFEKRFLKLKQRYTKLETRPI